MKKLQEEYWLNIGLMDEATESVIIGDSSDYTRTDEGGFWS
jgi:hypothetical protein